MKHKPAVQYHDDHTHKCQKRTQQLDDMTERFLSEEAREGIQINAIKEQTKALKEVAKKPTIQAEHYHAGDSTFDVHSKHLHLDHQEEGNSALLPSEL